MEKFAAASFYILLRIVCDLRNSSAEKLASGDGSYTFDESVHGRVKRFAESSEKNCRSLGLSLSAKASVHLATLLTSATVDLVAFRSALEQLERNIKWEMEDVLFFHTPASRASYYDHKELLGVTVNEKFPSVQFDIVEAGNCYALGRGTACVFHLMRVMEVGVQEFGSKLGVSVASTKNWQSILDEVNKAIRALPPKAPNTVALGEASANLYAVKLAWRNEVMHPNETYTLEEAENIIRQVKLFMTNLSAVL